MTLADSLHRLRRFFHVLQAGWREWSGAAAYARYVEQCARLRIAPLDRGRYFARRLDERYHRAGRCC